MIYIRKNNGKFFVEPIFNDEEFGNNNFLANNIISLIAEKWNIKIISIESMGVVCWDLDFKRTIVFSYVNSFDLHSALLWKDKDGSSSSKGFYNVFDIAKSKNIDLDFLQDDEWWNFNWYLYKVIYITPNISEKEYNSFSYHLSNDIEIWKLLRPCDDIIILDKILHNETSYFLRIASNSKKKYIKLQNRSEFLETQVFDFFKLSNKIISVYNFLIEYVKFNFPCYLYFFQNFQYKPSFDFLIDLSKVEPLYEIEVHLPEKEFKIILEVYFSLGEIVILTFVDFSKFTERLKKDKIPEQLLQYLEPLIYTEIRINNYSNISEVLKDLMQSKVENNSFFRMTLTDINSFL